MPKLLRLLVTIILVIKCFFCEAQIVHSSQHDDLGAVKKGSLSTSTSSGGGAGGFDCWATIDTYGLNLLDGTTALLCLNDSITLSASGQYYAQWYYNDFNNPVYPYIDLYGSASIVVKKPGAYYAESDGCVAGIVVTSTLPIKFPDSTVFCPGGSVTLKAPDRELSSYQWYSQKTLLKGEKQKKITATETGGYYVEVTDNNQCVLNSERINVNVYHAPASITVTGDSCVKAGLNLDASSSKLCPQSISWYKGSTLVKTFNNKGIVVAGGNGKGSGLDQLNQPYGIFLDSAKNVYVADYSNYRIVKWAPGASTGEVITQNLNLLAGNPTDVLWDKLSLYVGTTYGVIKFYPPFNMSKLTYANTWGLAIDSDRSIYWSDDKAEDPLFGGVGSVQKIDISGNASTVAGGNSSGDLTSINYPNGVYVDALKNVYVADNLTDSLNNYYGRIVKWAPGAATGELVVGNLGKGNAPNQIWFAAGIAFDKKGNMYVSDAVNNRVQLYKPGETHGVTIISGFRPWGIKVDDDMNVYVADQTHNRVIKFPSLLYNKFTANSAGNYKAVVAYPGGCTVTSNLVKVKNCGSFTKNLLSANKSNLQWNCTISPNPVQNILRVQLTNTHDNTTVFVMDVAGKKLFTQHISATGNDELNFNTGALRAGLYFVQVISNNQSQYLKFVKQ